MEIADFDEKIFYVEEEHFEIIHNLSELIFEDLIHEMVSKFLEPKLE